MTAQAVLPTDDVGNLVLQLIFGNQNATAQAVRVSLALATTGHNKNAVTAAALGRLDDETVEITHHVRELPHLPLVLDNAVKIGHGHAGIEREFLRQCLVVDPRIEAPWIEPHDEIGIALIQAQHTVLT